MTRENIDKMVSREVVFTTFLTVLGYLVSYFYNWGYLSHFGIPNIFITITTSSLIFSIAVTLLAGSATLFYILKYFIFEKQHQGKKWLVALRAIWIVGGLAIVLYSLGVLSFHIISAIFASLLLVSMLSLIVQIIRKRGIKSGWRETWRIWRENLTSSDPVLNLVPERISIYMGIAVLAISFSFITGSVKAGIQEEYPLIESRSGKPRLVISKNDSELITKEYDITTKSFDNTYFIESISNELRFKTFNIREER